MRPELNQHLLHAAHTAACNNVHSHSICAQNTPVGTNMLCELLKHVRMSVILKHLVYSRTQT